MVLWTPMDTHADPEGTTSRSRPGRTSAETGVSGHGDARSRSKYGYVVAIAMTLLLIAQMIPAGRQTLARRGILDLRDRSSHGGVARLEGEWEFYWGRLFLPADFVGSSSPPPDAYMRLPSVWTRSRLHGTRLPSVGDATFRLKILHSWKGRELGVKLGKVNLAYELYADSRLVACAGRLSDNPGGFAGAYKSQSVYFSPASDETVLILRVSNRVPGAWSGPVENIVIGPREAIVSETNGSIAADVFNLSGRLLFFVLFLVLFLITRSPLAAAYSATSLVMALRISLSREMVFLHVFPVIDIYIFERLYLFVTLSLLPFLLFSFEAFLREGEGRTQGIRERISRPFAAWGVRDWVMVVVAMLTLGMALLLIVADNAVFFRFFLPFVPLSIGCYFYYSALVFRDAVRRRLGTGPVGIYLLFFLYTAFEILCQTRVIDQEYMFPLFFLRGLPTLAGLATVQIQQGIVSYLDIAFFSFYFLYDILRRHFAGKSAGTESVAASSGGGPGPAPAAERDKIVFDDPGETAMIRERVEKAIEDPAILGKPDLDIRALAAIVKIPPYRLSSWFNSCLSTSFPAYLNARRIARAQALIVAHPERTMIDIAMEAGYASKSAFNEQFKRVAGKSPSEWKRGNGEAER